MSDVHSESSLDTALRAVSDRQRRLICLLLRESDPRPVLFSDSDWLQRYLRTWFRPIDRSNDYRTPTNQTEQRRYSKI